MSDVRWLDGWRLSCAACNRVVSGFVRWMPGSCVPDDHPEQPAIAPGRLWGAPVGWRGLDRPAWITAPGGASERCANCGATLAQRDERWQAWLTGAVRAELSKGTIAEPTIGDPGAIVDGGAVLRWLHIHLGATAWHGDDIEALVADDHARAFSVTLVWLQAQASRAAGLPVDDWVARLRRSRRLRVWVH